MRIQKGRRAIIPDRNKPYIQMMGRVLLMIIVVLIGLDLLEYRFRSGALQKQHNQERVRLLVRDNMKLIEDTIEDAIGLIQSESVQIMLKRREVVSKTTSKMDAVHHKLMQASSHTEMGFIFTDMDYDDENIRYFNGTLKQNRDEDNPLKILHHYYQILKNNISNLRSLELKVLKSLAQSTDTVREFLYDDPSANYNEQEGDSIAYEFDMGKLAQMFNQINQNQLLLRASREYWIWIAKIVFRFLAVLIVWKLWVIVKRKEEDVHVDKIKLKQHHKEDQLNIDIAKNLFILINGFIPRYVSLRGDLSLFCESIINPCHAEGGDHSGMVKVGECFFFYHADESGHDVTTILSSAQMAIIFRRAVKRSCSGDFKSCPCNNVIPAIMEGMNEALCTIYPEGHYCTMITGRINIQTLQMRYVVAGHPRFYLIRNDKVLALPEGTEGRSGMVGILEDTRYIENSLHLQPDDKLVLLTDGFYEAVEPGAEKRSGFGEDRVSATISSHADKSAGVIYDRLCEAVSEFSGKELGTIFRRVPAPGKVTRNTVELVNGLDDDASAMLFKIEKMGSFDRVFEFTPDDSRPGKYIDRMEKYLEETLPLKGFIYLSINPIITSLDEAVMNAWKHGNQQKPLSIKVTFKFSNDLIVQVYDHGKGVDPRTVPDPTLSENLDKPSGRGMFMMRELSSETKWFLPPKDDQYSFCVRMIWHRKPNDDEKDYVRRMCEASLLNFRPRKSDLPDSVIPKKSGWV